jgi:hypothetical protein
MGKRRIPDLLWAILAFAVLVLLLLGVKTIIDILK